MTLGTSIPINNYLILKTKSLRTTTKQSKTLGVYDIGYDIVDGIADSTNTTASRMTL